MAALRIIVAGGDEQSRDRLVSRIIEELRLRDLPASEAVRVYATDDDADAIRFRSLTTF